VVVLRWSWLVLTPVVVVGLAAGWRHKRLGVMVR